MTKKKINKYSKNSKTHKNKLSNENIVKLTEKQIDFLFLYKIIINHLLLLMNNKVSANKTKNIMMILFKEMRIRDTYISKNTTDEQLDKMIIKIYDQVKILKKKIDMNIKKNIKNIKNIKYSHKTLKNEALQNNALKNDALKNNTLNNILKSNIKQNNKYKGGFYFKNLEDKGDQPLTGTDLTKLLDEMQQFFYNAQYTQEGEFLRDTNLLMSMFRGDAGQFKYYLQYRILPQYIQVTPPFIKWDGFKKALDTKKYEDLPDYLIAYQSYMRSQDEYLVEKGLKSPSVLNKDLYTGFYDKLSKSLDVNIQKYQMARRNIQRDFILPF